MNTPKLVVISIVTALAVAVGVTYFAPTKTETVREIKEIKELGAIPGNSVDSQRFCIGGVCKDYSSGTCYNSTTTFFSLRPPSRATSTIESIKLYGNNGTTTFYGRVGTSTSPSINTFLTNQLSPTFMQFVVSTSTGFYIQDRTFAGAGPTSTLSSFSNATTSGFTGKFIVGPDEFLVGAATGTVASHNATAMQGLTNTNNEFDCDYSVEWSALNL